MTVPRIWRKNQQYYNLVGKKCSECSAMFFPPRSVCTECGGIAMLDHRFQGVGNIVTFTVNRTPMPDPEGEILDIPARSIPYVLAVIRLAEGPSLTAEIIEADIDGIEIGKKVSVVFRKLVEKGERGIIQYGYKFRLER
ncbi:MAG: Zn-ribbon domain-containing OB-fold protein [Nanoarchaeota archaeon]|nr:Zn-ribbon domain-containing OB-fold protein [Nanoarchaeota archaeon]